MEVEAGDLRSRGPGKGCSKRAAEEFGGPFRAMRLQRRYVTVLGLRTADDVVFGERHPADSLWNLRRASSGAVGTEVDVGDGGMK